MKDATTGKTSRSKRRTSGTDWDRLRGMSNAAIRKGIQADPEARSRVLMELFRAGLDLGGVLSGEHGIGTAKKPYFMALEDPVKLALMRRIKQAFDPAGILNPGKIFE